MLIWGRVALWRFRAKPNTPFGKLPSKSVHSKHQGHTRPRLRRQGAHTFGSILSGMTAGSQRPQPPLIFLSASQKPSILLLPHPRALFNTWALLGHDGSLWLPLITRLISQLEGRTRESRGGISPLIRTWPHLSGVITCKLGKLSRCTGPLS